MGHLSLAIGTAMTLEKESNSLNYTDAAFYFQKLIQWDKEGATHFSVPSTEEIIILTSICQ